MKTSTLGQLRCLTFGRNPFAQFRLLYLPLLFLLLSQAFAQAQNNPLAPAEQFNIFTEGNVTLTNNESEGPAAIGGNVTITGNYNIASSFTGNFTQAGFPEVKIGLVVGGGVKLDNGILRVLNKTFMKICNCEGGSETDALRVWYRDQNNATTPIRVTKSKAGFNASSFIELNGNVNDFYATLADTANYPICQSHVIDFASAFATLKVSSNTLMACQNTIRATDPNGNPITNYSSQNLRLSDPEGGQPTNTTRVFNISGSDLNAINELALEFTPTASQPLLINVSTGDTFDWVVKNQNVSGTMKYIIWNFPSATTLNIVGFATIEGSVLAPNAAVFKNTTNNSNIEGQLIAQSFDMNGGEMHHFPFEGNLNCGTPPACNAPTPTADDVERCGPGTVTFTATGCTTGYTPTWYTDLSLDTQVGSGSPFTTPVLSQTTDYYVACVKSDDPTCKSDGVKVAVTVTPKPTIGTINTTAATCDNTTTNNDASFTISGISGGQRYSFATTQAGLLPYATATVLNGDTIAESNLANPEGQQYFVRIYTSKADCFHDTSFTIPYRDCVVTCVKPDAGSDVFICDTTTQVELNDATGPQKWMAEASNPAGTINPATGLATGLTADGQYSFILVDTTAGSTCADTVFVVRSPANFDDITTCDDTLTLPASDNGTWTVASGNTASVTPAGEVSGLGTPGNYVFNLTNGNCITTVTVIRQDCGGTCPAIVAVGDDKDTLCSGYYGEAMAVKVVNNLPVNFVRFTTPQTAASVYSGGTLLDTVTPTDSIAGWPNGLPGSQFPANTGTTPVTYYVYAILADTTQLPTDCRPFGGKIYTVLPLPKITQSTEPVCEDSTNYQAKITLPAGTYTVTLARGFSSIGNGPIPEDIIQQITGVSGSTTITLALADSAAAVIVLDEATGCASLSPVINPNLVTCDKLYDLVLKKTISSKLAMVGDDISYTIKVWNEGQGDATGIEVTDSLNAGVQYITHSTATGNYDTATKIWTVGTLAAGDTATITIAVKVIAEGVWFNTAEITKMNEKDVDSTPGNGVEGEDDIDRACFTVPILLCRGQEGSVELAVPQQYSGVVWFRKVPGGGPQGGEPVQVATGNTYAATETELGSYEYTFTSTAGSCPAEGCCPIIIAVQDCCPVEICVPFVIQRVKMPR